MPRYASKSAWRSLGFGNTLAAETEAHQVPTSPYENVALNDSSVAHASHMKKEVRRKEANVTTNRFIAEYLIESQRIDPLSEKQVERMRRATLRSATGIRWMTLPHTTCGLRITYCKVITSRTSMTMITRTL